MTARMHRAADEKNYQMKVNLDIFCHSVVQCKGNVEFLPLNVGVFLLLPSVLCNI